MIKNQKIVEKTWKNKIIYPVGSGIWYKIMMYYFYILAIKLSRYEKMPKLSVEALVFSLSMVKITVYLEFQPRVVY